MKNFDIKIYKHLFYKFFRTLTIIMSCIDDVLSLVFYNGIGILAVDEYGHVKFWMQYYQGSSYLTCIVWHFSLEIILKVL